MTAYGGLDISSGKRHPSHLAIIRTEDGVYYQTVSEWFDETALNDVLEACKALCDEHGVSRLLFDNTRDELTVPMARGDVPGNWEEERFTAQGKFEMARRLEYVLNAGELKLLPDERQQRQLALVNDMLKAEETAEGHADCFWSIALAVKAAMGKSTQSAADYYAAILGWNRQGGPQASEDEMSSTELAKEKIRHQSALWRIGK